jgi:hypothetical protein
VDPTGLPLPGRGHDNGWNPRPPPAAGEPNPGAAAPRAVRG